MNNQDQDKLINFALGLGLIPQASTPLYEAPEFYGNELVFDPNPWALFPLIHELGHCLRTPEGQSIGSFLKANKDPLEHLIVYAIEEELCKQLYIDLEPTHDSLRSFALEFHPEIFKKDILPRLTTQYTSQIENYMVSPVYWRIIMKPYYEQANKIVEDFMSNRYKFTQEGVLMKVETGKNNI